MTKEWNSWLLNSFLRVRVYTCLSQEHTLATVSATNDRSRSQGKRRGRRGGGGQSLWRHILKVVTTIQRMLQTGKKVVWHSSFWTVQLRWCYLLQGGQ